ncbi:MULTISPECIES: tripartite tricarboxylate transporter TctB family protein [Halomonas]|uniref:tripartite tricarboxylate transporter TctB family protein n=1 Tax=Halomonas TaxID=2745 RepID=UPI001C941CF7|nr:MULTISPECIES: tripartite tricarboxylate transporter TctB family protein [Halomonas]MBY5925724.1 tripartite tricarboxylate transporter TctB family protein [Halomonas sp. DP4Y7-2]MBY6207913.1 tripartite tricarboxylate transporter TctB family protein [Halomonas sp. DP3Y7-2]MBY6228722.1 tripartite tricarboxylate transporter TctB family protein [Halomonas sp. DP3Y7-1]MBY6232457.1 tripartite tricarboxylate transporter TctB family protein [Halomonas sp. DP4Y7-1]MCA0917294.1 tripartite tricarboxyla
MKLSRLLFGLLALGVAALFGITSLGYPSAAARMPLIYAVVVAAFALAMIAQEVLGARRARTAEASHRPTREGSQLRDVQAHDPAAVPGEADTADAIDSAGHAQSPIQNQAQTQTPPAKPVKALMVFALAVVYVQAINYLGYVIATAAFMGLALVLVRHVSLRFSLIGIAALITVVCLVFIGFLGLPVPLLPSLS